MMHSYVGIFLYCWSFPLHPMLFFVAVVLAVPVVVGVEAGIHSNMYKLDVSRMLVTAAMCALCA